MGNMKNGYYVPISINLVSELPMSRAYTKLEAAYCLQLDYYKDNQVTVAGYSALWSWSRKKVNAFLEAMNIKIEYPENTQKKQNQKGQIRIQIRDRSGTDQGQIRLIDNKGLQTEKDRSGTDQGQIRDRSGSTTINNNNNEEKDILPKPPEKPDSPKKPKKPKKVLPLTDPPEIEQFLIVLNENKKFQEFLVKQQVDLGVQPLADLVESCFDYHIANGKKKKDWIASMRMWIKTGIGYGNIKCIQDQPPPIKNYGDNDFDDF